MADKTQPQPVPEPRAEAVPPDPGFGPGRTPRLGLRYTNDASMNANLDLLDTAVGNLQDAAAPAK